MGGPRPRGIKKGPVSIKRIQARLSQGRGKILAALASAGIRASGHRRGRRLGASRKELTHPLSTGRNTWPDRSLLPPFSCSQGQSLPGHRRSGGLVGKAPAPTPVD